MWDRGLRVRNVVFMNFPSNETRAIYGPIILDRCTDRCGGMNDVIIITIFGYFSI